MANTLTEVIPSIVTQGLMALRQMVTMPRLINTNYSSDAASKGDTITVPKPASITTVAVSPSNTAPSTADITPENATIALDKWYEAPFYLTDKDLKDAFNGITPMQVTSAIASLTEQVNGDCMSLYKDVYGFAGTAATTPFGSNYSEASAVRKVLNEQKAFMSDRRLVIDPDAEENAINLSSFKLLVMPLLPVVLLLSWMDKSGVSLVLTGLWISRYQRIQRIRSHRPAC